MLHAAQSDTAIGPVVVAWEPRGRHPVLRHLFLPSPDESAWSKAERTLGSVGQGAAETVQDLADALASYLRGDAVVLPCPAAWLDRLPAFQRRILDVTARIPRGRVASYRAVAVAAGCPAGARAAGGALGRNPLPLFFPCHRVICSDRSQGGFTSGGGLKERLLALEGVRWDARMRVLPEYILATIA